MSNPSDILKDWLKKKTNLHLFSQERGSWRGRDDVFVSLCGDGKQNLMKVIDKKSSEAAVEEEFILKEKQTLILPRGLFFKPIDSGKTQDYLYEVYIKNGISLDSWMLRNMSLSDSHYYNSKIYFIKISEIIISAIGQIKQLNEFGYNFADQLNNISMNKDTMYMIPQRIHPSNFHNHIYESYLKAYSGDYIYNYPPEFLKRLLNNNINQENIQIERDEKADVWAIGVLIFLLLGGGKKRLVEHTSMREAIRDFGLLDNTLNGILLNIFQDKPENRCSLAQIQAYFVAYKSKKIDRSINPKKKYVTHEFLQALLDKAKLFEKEKTIQEAIETFQDLIYLITLNETSEEDKQQYKDSNLENLRVLLQEQEQEQYTLPLMYPLEINAANLQKYNSKQFSFIKGILELLAKAKTTIETNYLSSGIGIFVNHIFNEILKQEKAQKINKNDSENVNQEIIAENLRNAYQQAKIRPSYETLGDFLLCAYKSTESLENFELLEELSEIYQQIVKEFYEAGEFDIAIELSQKMLRQNENNIDAIVFQGEYALTNKNSPKEAIELAQKAISISPNNSQALFLKAKSEQQLNGKLSSFSEILKVIHLAPGHEEHYLVLAEALLAEDNNLEEAIMKFQAYANAENKNNTFFQPQKEAFYYFGQVFEKQENSNLAEEQYQKQIKQSSASHVQSYLKISKIYQKQNKIDKAIEILEECVKNNPKAEKPYLEMIELFKITNQTNKSQEIIEKYSNLTFEQILQNVFLKLGEEEIIKGKIQSANACFQLALKQFPQNVNLKAYFTQLYLDKNAMLIEAKALIEEAISMAPQILNNKLILAKICIKKKQLEQAESVLEKLISLNPFYSEALCELGKINLNHKKNYKISLELLQQSNALNPTQEGLQDALGIAYFKLGNIELALMCLEPNVTVDDVDTKFREKLFYAKCLIEVNRYEESIVLLKKLKKTTKNNQKIPIILFYLGISSYKHNKNCLFFLQEAIEDFVKEDKSIQAKKCYLVQMINKNKYSVLYQFLMKNLDKTSEIKDPELHALICEGFLQCGVDYQLAMNEVELGLEINLFDENKEKDVESLKTKGCFHEGCMIQYARILFQFMNEQERAMEILKRVQDQIEKKKTQSIVVDDQMSSSFSQLPTKTEKLEKQKSRKIFFEMDWSISLNLLLAEILISLDKYDQAADIIQSLFEHQSDRVQRESAHLQAMSLCKQNKIIEAIIILNSNTRNGPSCFLLGELFQKQSVGLAKSRIKMYEALQKVPQNVQYAYTLAEIKYQENYPNLALQLLKGITQRIDTTNAVLQSIDETRRKDLPKRRIKMDYIVHLRTAQCLVLQNESEESVRFLTLCLDQNPIDPIALLWYARAMILRNKIIKAQKLLNQSLKYQENNADAYYFLGKCQIILNNTFQAKEYFEKAEKLDPNNFGALQSLGEMYWKQKMYKEGKQYFEKCLVLNKSDEIAVIGCVCCDKKIGNSTQPDNKLLQELENYLINYLSLKASDLCVMELLVLFEETSKLPNFQFLQKHSKVLENNIAILFHLGNVFFKAGGEHLGTSQNYFTILADKFKRQKDAQKNKNFAFEKATTYANLAKICFQTKKFKESLGWIYQFKPLKLVDVPKQSEQSKGDTCTTINFEAFLLEAKLRLYYDKKGASQLLFKCIKLMPQNEIPYQMLAMELIRLNSIKKAKEFFELGQKKQSENDVEATNTGISEYAIILEVLLKNMQEQDMKRKQQNLETTILRNPHEILYYHLGSLFFNQGNYESAIKNYQKTLDLLSDRRDLKNSSKVLILSWNKIRECMCCQAIALMKLKKFSQALKIIDECLVKFPNDIKVLEIKVELKFQQDLTLEVLQFSWMFLQSTSNSAETFYQLAVVNMRRHIPYTAIACLERCSQIDITFPYVQFKIGLIYEKLLRPQLALENYLKFLAYNPCSAAGLLKTSRLLAYFGNYSLSKKHIRRLFEILKCRKNTKKGDKQSEESTKLEQQRTQQLRHLNAEKNNILEVDDHHNDIFVTLADAQSVLGYLQYKKKDFHSALQSYLEVLKLQLDNEDASFSIARIYSELGYSKLEIESYENLLKQRLSQKKQQMCNNNMGNAYLKIKDYKNAIKQYFLAVISEERGTRILINIGWCYLAQRQHNQAIDILEKAISFEDGIPEAYFLLGLAWQNQGETGKAQKYFQLSTKCDATYAIGYLYQAEIKFEAGKLQEAIQICQNCLEYCPNDTQVLLLLGDCQFKVGDFWGALGLFEQILNRLPSEEECPKRKDNINSIQVKCNIQISRIFQQLHEPNKAIEYLQNCISSSKDHPAYLSELGSAIIRNRGDLAEALKLQKEASNACPDNPVYLFNMADTLHCLHQYDLEVQTLEQCLEMLPPFFDKIYNNLALAYASLHKNEQAISTLKQGLQITPDSQELHFSQGNILYSMNRLEEARSSFQKCIELNPSHVGALHNLGMISIYLKDYKKSGECFRHCLNLCPERKQLYLSQLNILIKKDLFSAVQ